MRRIEIPFIPHTTVVQHLHTLYCRVLAVYIGAALYRICARLINCTAFSVLREETLASRIIASEAGTNYRSFQLYNCVKKVLRYGTCSLWTTCLSTCEISHIILSLPGKLSVGKYL